MKNSSYSELSLQNISLFEGSSSAKADGIQTVASQQTYCLWYMRAASCRKQPKTNSTPHRGTILIQALLPPCVLKTVSSPYLHKPHNSRFHPTYANTDSECVRECVPATTGHSPDCSTAIFWSRQSWCTQWLLPDEREGGGVVVAAQILQCSGLTSKDLLTYSTCCCLLILLQPPVLLLTGAPCEWDVAAFGDDLYMCEINHFTRPNSISVGEEKCIFITRPEMLSPVILSPLPTPLWSPGN